MHIRTANNIIRKVHKDEVLEKSIITSSYREPFEGFHYFNDAISVVSFFNFSKHNLFLNFKEEFSSIYLTLPINKFRGF